MSKSVVKTIKISEKEYMKICQQNAEMKETIELLKQALFGRKSEKTSKQDIITVEFNQLTIFDLMKGCNVDQLENISPEKKPVKENPEEKEQKTKGRRVVAINLPERELIIKVPEKDHKDENGEDLVLIGYEYSEKLHRIPEEFVRLIIKREKWGYKDSREIVNVAPKLDAIIPKGKLTDGVIHHIVFEKFYNGMPLYRQQKSLNALGADLSKSTMSDSVKGCSKLYTPVVGAIKQQVLSSKYVHADESPLKYKSTVKKKYKKGYIFVYQDTEQVYFHFGESRSQKMISNVLGKSTESGKYLGYLMCDGYAGYNIFTGKRLACWAHARRKFFKIADKNPNAKDILNIINELYIIERKVSKKRNENEFFEYRYKIRNSESKKMIDLLKEKLFLYENQCTPGSSMGKAISYTKNRWKELQVYLEDGCLPVDNNAAERSIRSMVVGRKNFLFVGSEDAGEWAANCYTIMESCRLQGIDPRAYMEVVTPILLENKNNSDYDYGQITPRFIVEQFPDIRKMQKNL
ncbi:IS66 family transposase [bacterium]|nr:IS66 family transposase [bacterium]